MAATVAALALCVAAVGAPGSLARATKPKIVKVCDDYYTPTTVRIRKGLRVKWKWATACGTDTHDVTLLKGPTGVKKRAFRSQTARSPFSFTKRFKKPGTYEFYCTRHPTVMQMTVRVRRPS